MTGGLCAVFLAVELAFLGANLIKLGHGGAFPLAIGLLGLAVMSTWKTGRARLRQQQYGTVRSNRAAPRIAPLPAPHRAALPRHDVPPGRTARRGGPGTALHDPALRGAPPPPHRRSRAGPTSTSRVCAPSCGGGAVPDRSPREPDRRGDDRDRGRRARGGRSTRSPRWRTLRIGEHLREVVDGAGGNVRGVERAHPLDGRARGEGGREDRDELAAVLDPRRVRREPRVARPLRPPQHRGEPPEQPVVADRRPGRRRPSGSWYGTMLGCAFPSARTRGR